MLEVFYTTPSVWTKCAFFPVFLLPTECPLCCFFMTVSIHTSTISFTKRSRCPSVQISPEPSAFPVIKTILTIVNIKEWQTLHKWLLLQKPRPWGFSMNQMRGLKYLIISNAFKTMALASSIFRVPTVFAMLLVLNRQPLRMPEKKIVASKCQMLKSSLEKMLRSTQSLEGIIL